MNAQEKLELVDRVIEHLRKIQLLNDKIHDEINPEEEGLEELVDVIIDFDIALESAIAYCEAL
jgi:hypothetical protein